MKSFLKRLGATGIFLLVLNEIRGVIFVAMALGALFDLSVGGGYLGP